MRKLVLVMVIALMFILTGCQGDETVHTGLNPGMDTIEINEEWYDAGAYLTVGEVYIVQFSEDDVDTSVLGEYTVMYIIRHEEVDYDITRMVLVLDQTAPVVTLLEGVDTITVNDDWTDGGCAVTDNSEEVLVCTTDSVVDTTTAGIYEVIYTAEDSSGNEGSMTRIVTVVE